jgi:hypothetical protein
MVLKKEVREAIRRVKKNHFVWEVKMKLIDAADVSLVI